MLVGALVACAWDDSCFATPHRGYLVRVLFCVCVRVGICVGVGVGVRVRVPLILSYEKG